MINYISGTIKLKAENFLILENNGLGYKVFVATDILNKVKANEPLELYTYQHVREDALQLFGFNRYEELRLFEQLISVSGVGPKTALGIFNVAGANDIISAIVSADASVLKKVSGIGVKTAERIVLELKNKVMPGVGIGEMKSVDELGVDSDAVEALVSLGYSVNQGREVLKKVEPEIKDAGQRVKAALKIINSKF